MLTVAFGIQFLLLLVVPVATGFWFNRRLALSWRLFFGGALAFVSAWVVSNFIPLPGELGFMLASITQMGALYLIYRFQLKVDTEREALMAGLGQGGIELILVGLFAVLSFVQMSPLRNATDETIISLAARTDGVSEEEIEPARVDEIRELIDDYWSTPWYGPLIQTIQSLTFLPIQAALAVVVLGALAHSNWRPLLFAMALHFLSRILPAFGGILAGPVVWLGLSLLFGGIAFRFLKRLWSVVQNQTESALRERRKAEKRASHSA